MSWTVTLKDLRKAGACFKGYNRVVRSLQGKEFTAEDAYRESYIAWRHIEPIQILTILESNGIDDALWALRCVTGHDREIRLYAVWCAKQVQHLMKDPRSIAALEVAERFADGEATQEELKSARYAAGDAAWTAARAAAWDAEQAAARAAALDAARDAAWAAALAAALDAALAARDAAQAAARDAAQAAARDVARDAAWAAAWDAQKAKLIEIIEKGI